jgi:hypothetical protein
VEDSAHHHALRTIITGIVQDDQVAIARSLDYINNTVGPDGVRDLCVGLAMSLKSLMDLPEGAVFGFEVLDDNDQLTNPEEVGCRGEIAGWRFIMACLNEDVELATCLFNDLEEPEDGADFVRAIVEAVRYALKYPSR